MIQMFGQMMWMPVSMLACWMDVVAAMMRGMPPGAGAGNRFASAPGTGLPDAGPYRDNPWAQGNGANQEAKEDRTMSDCCDNDDDGMVKLVEYTIVTIKRGGERILKKSEILYTEDMSDEAFATWVVALYLQEDGVHVPHDDKKYLRVYHRLLDSWARQSLECCERQLDVLRGIEEAIRHLRWPREEGTVPAQATS